MPNQPTMRTRTIILPAILSFVAVCALGGCSDSSANYPSLASRPAERLTDNAQPVVADAPEVARGVPSPELVARLDYLVEQARSARRDFGDKQATAETLVSAAGSAPAGSEDWARATQALSGIESARSLTAQPLSDLDRIEIDDNLAHPAQAGEQASRLDAIVIAQAHKTVSALVAEEDAVLARLNGRLAS